MLEHYLAIKTSELQLHVPILINFKNLMLSKKPSYLCEYLNTE